MNIILDILFGVCILFSFTVIMSPLYFKWGIGKWFYHDIMQWHQPRKNEANTFDGVSEHNHCRHCGKAIMQDSQGNWFAWCDESEDTE